MERLFTIMRKEIFHIWRDPRTMAMVLLLPALLLVLLGYGVNFDSKDTPLAVADLSKSAASQRYIQRFTASDDFELAYDAGSEEELLALIDNNEVDAALLIPEDFGRKVSTGEPVQVQLFINGATDPSEVQGIRLKLSSISQMAAQDILIQQLQRSPQGAMIQLPVDALEKTLYNPDSTSRLFMVPGLIPIILQIQALILSALSIVKEREQGTMEQLIVTPIRSWELMLGKIIPYLLVSVFNLFALLWLGDLLFGVQVAGSYWELVALSLVFIVGSLGMGVLISNVSQTQMQAIYLAIFVVLIPAIILTGLMFPRDNMPMITYIYSELLPVTHFLEIARGIMLRGVSAAAVWSSTVPLIGLSFLYFIASVLVFKKRIT
jgi:ABC-2 type transport system permease protein